MIELGLARITRLLKDTPIPWRAIHIAGTNGKGSVCAYTSAMLNAANIRSGRFTSPHLINRWDCITINEETVNENLFYEVENAVKTRDRNEGIKSSEFELLTATAFEIFNREKIEIGIIEVGMGGRHDATNVFDHPLVTVITKIGEDHQNFLGTTLEEIAYQKAGIMKKGVPCVVDGSNPPRVLEILQKNANDVEAASIILVSQDFEPPNGVWEVLARDHFEKHQQMNIVLAFRAVQEALGQGYPSVEPTRLLPAIHKAVWLGRLQKINIGSLVGRKQDILLDGAHNAQSAEVLGSYVDRKLRDFRHPVTWIIAMSKGKDLQDVLSRILRPGDNILAVEFGPVDGMPWVKPEEVTKLLEVSRNFHVLGYLQETSGRLEEALVFATNIANQGPIVVAGSLYLVSDVFRLLLKSKKSTAMRNSEIMFMSNY